MVAFFYLPSCAILNKRMIRMKNLPKKKILVLEDNKVIREGIKTYLENCDYLVAGVSKIFEFKKLFLKEFDIFILDINLPDGNAFEVVEKIKNLEKPIIFLTVKNEDEDIIKGLEVGGDDYITKPFSLNVLKARIETVLRRYADKNSEIINFKDLSLDKKSTGVYIKTERIDLTHKEYELIELFLENIGKTITREYLIENFWDKNGEFINDNTLSVTIARLREKLGDYGRNLITVRGLGYRFDYEE